MKKSSFAHAAEAVLIALALCVMVVLAFSVQRLSEKSNLAALSAVGGSASLCRTSSAATRPSPSAPTR